MSTKPAVLVFAALLFSLPALADDPHCPCIPMAQVWNVTACRTWNEAIATIVAANGEPTTFALPTRSADYPWVVVRKIGAEGSMISSPDMQPFDVEPFSATDLASLRFQTIDPAFVPMMVTTGDGNVLVIHLHDAARVRAIRH